MGSEWRTATVAELQREGILLVEDGNHGEYRPRPHEFVDAGVAFIRAADMDGGRVLFDSASRINDLAVRRITKGIGALGDVLLSHKGTVGKVALVLDDAPPFVCSPQTTFWRTLDPSTLDRGYLYAFLRSAPFREQLSAREAETDMAPYVSLTSQRGLFVPLPPIGRQRDIARILGSFDDKIELNRRMSQTLESMARALFKSWFVDFDPVRAKSEGRESGLPEHIADLAPDSFEDSDIGEIPRGWRVVPLERLAQVRGGTQLPAGELRVVGASPVYGANGLMGYAERRTHDGFVIAFGRVGAYCGSLHWTYNGAWINNNASSIEPAAWPEFVLLSLLKVDFASMRTGSAQPFIPNWALSATEILQPPPRLMEEFCRVARPVWRQRWELERNSLALASSRDALLPRLIGGGLSVPSGSELARSTQ